MLSIWDPVTLLNALLCVMVVLFGFTCRKKSDNKAILDIMVAFALFAISHFLSLIAGVRFLGISVILIRVLAYILVVTALYRMVPKKQEAK